jgi:urea transport system substrate-binding protein
MVGWGKFLALLWFLAASIGVQAQNVSREPIRIGVIYSETGTMMTSEQPLVAATRVAVEEINADGGILGRRLEIVFRDGQSDPMVAANAARRLIREDGAVALFGCWTSACRKAVMEVVEQEGVPLYYPVQYEGRGSGELPLDPSPNVFYAGAAPNQQIVPVLDWILAENSSPRIVLIGSDYVYPRSANAFIRKMLEGTGAEIVDERYYPLGSADFAGLAARLRSLRPDVILNTVNGIDNIALFDVIARYDRDGRRTRTVSFSIDENQLRDIGEANFVGRYAVWDYFHDPRVPRVARFTQRYRQFGGSDDWLTSDPVEAAYLLVHLFAESARRTGAMDLASLRRGSRNIVLQGFSGPLIVDAQTQHLWKPALISRYGEARQFEPVWRSHLLIQPVPILENMPGQFARVLRYPLANRDVALQMLRSANPIDRLRGYRWLSINRVPIGRGDIIDPATASFTLSEQAALVSLLGLQPDEDFLADFAWLLQRFSQREQQLAIAIALSRLEAVSDGDAGPVAEAIYALADRETDPYWRRTMLVALAYLHKDGDSVLGRALDRAASENPSVFLPALNVMQDRSIEDPAFYVALAKLPQRRDFASVPGLSRAFCATLERQLSLAMSEGAALPRGLSDVIGGNRAVMEASCPQVLATYVRVSGSSFGNLVQTLTPNSLEGWLVFCFILALIPVIAWNLIQGLALWIAPAWAIRRLRPFRDPPAWVPAFFHDAFRRVPRIGLKSRALDAWIAANRQAFAPAGKLDFYQDLVVELSQEGKRTVAIADERLIKSLVSAGNLDEVVRLAILGEGGVGKSTLSEALLRVLSENSDSQRIGVFIEAEAIDDLENVARVREAIRMECVKRLAQARETGRGARCEFENDVLMNELLRTGRLVVVLDDLSRALDQNWMMARTPEFETDFGAVVYTGRFPVAPFRAELYPQPLDRIRLAAFVESNVARSGKEFRPEQRHVLSESLDQIFAGRDQVPALFAVLIAQHFVNPSDDIAEDEPITIPALVLSYVDSLVSTISPNEMMGVEPGDFWRLFGALSWDCIARGLRVSHVSAASAEKAISRYVDEGDERELLDLLCERTQLVHRVRNNRVVVASDALAEYLAAC